MAVNKVILIGNVGRDPELRHLPDGRAVTSFSIATTERWKDKGGQQQEKTEWHNIVTFDRLAEICGEYLSKGKQVYIEGRLQTRSWEKDGQKQYRTEIVAREMKMLGKRDDAPAKGAGGRARGDDALGGEMPPDADPEYSDDDIPF